MKKLLYIGALSTLLLTGCGDDSPPDETPNAVAKEEYTIDDAIKSVTKKPYELNQNEGIVSITIEDEKLHEGSKSAILKDSAELFAELSKIENVTAPIIKWTSTLTDADGNEHIGEILSIMFDAETFAKVNWDNYKDLDIEEIAYGYKQHEALK